ncbi:AMP-binding protein [Pusillimonas sp. TS35]|nr:AMP-binding protein [Pusillimonas sp. TS35]
MNTIDFLALLDSPARSGLSAIQTTSETISYGALSERVRGHADRLVAHGTRVAASLLDNGPGWIIHDLACLRASVVHVPLPLFFTPEQWGATLNAAGVDTVIASGPLGAVLAAFGFERAGALPAGQFLFRRTADASLPAGTAKITFTSGSTGSPKGVCLAASDMLAVAAGVAQATKPLAVRRHLTALPLAILLENIAGVYAPLMEGAAVVVRPLGEVGLQGSSHFDPGLFHEALNGCGAHSVIVMPQMLRAYAGWLQAARAAAPGALRLMAVGGAAVGAQVLGAARSQGIPAFEGYGLSEACSVQTLNLPDADCSGSAGRPLPHARVRIADDGEIEVAGCQALGYLGQPFARREWLATGDLGFLDDAGFLHIRGRKKNVLVTGFGRNVSPEWIEAQLASQPAVAQAVVLGDGQPALGAVLWPLGDASDDVLRACIDRVNQDLPDYARIGPWMRAHADFSTASGLATANGRPRRDAVAAMHAELFPRVSA